MSEWIEQRLEELYYLNEQVGPGIYERDIAILEAMKLAEEALENVKRRMMRHDAYADGVIGALAAFDELGKDHSPDAGKKVE